MSFFIFIVVVVSTTTVRRLRFLLSRIAKRIINLSFRIKKISWLDYRRSCSFLFILFSILFQKRKKLFCFHSISFYLFHVQAFIAILTLACWICCWNLFKVSLIDSCLASVSFMAVSCLFLFNNKIKVSLMSF